MPNLMTTTLLCIWAGGILYGMLAAMLTLTMPQCEELAQAINLPKMILLIATWPLSLPAIITFEMATRNR